MADKVELNIDGEPVTGTRSEPLLSLLQARGCDVPTLCHHPSVRPFGACRLCLVEVARKGKTRLTTSCNYPVLEGIDVTTDSERIRKHRKVVLELMMARAPGVLEIEELAERYGADSTRMVEPERTEPCILCGLCVRVCREVVGASVLAFVGRGGTKRVATPYGELPDSCIGCGACAAVCPTGAINVAFRAAERFRAADGADRLCRYALMGLTPGAVCARSYECEGCEVEQSLAHQMGDHPVMLARGELTDEVIDYLDRRKRARADRQGDSTPDEGGLKS
jgi:NAD-dependent dihydropyrimidine dehydrogenase PreA subunit